MDPFGNLKAITAANANSALMDARHEENQLAAIATQQTIAQSFKYLVDYLDSHVSKAEVVNQLHEIGTPDAERVVEAVERLHATVQTHENTDLSPVTAILQAVLEEARQIPKQLPDVPEQQFVDYSERFKELEAGLDKVTKAIEAQETHVAAPVVNVPAPKVDVAAPDLQPIQTGLESVIKAVKAIDIPEYKATDIKPLEKLLKQANKTLDELLDKPVGGGGGGGRVTPYQTAENAPAFVDLADGAIPANLKAYDGDGILHDLTAVESADSPGTFGLVGLNADGSAISGGGGGGGGGTPAAGTSVLSNVSGATSSTTLLAANSGRLGATIINDSTADLYVKFGSSASTTSYTVLLTGGDYYEVPFRYTDIITGIWSVATGAARVTEVSS
jgi:hypothetical protein